MATKINNATPWMNWGPPTSKYIFGDILKKGMRTGRVPGRDPASIKWFRSTARTYNSLSTDRLLKETSQIRTSVVPGSMYMFAYEAKHKATLPYYDAFPLIFPFKMLNDGFLGINFHYLQPQLRALLMDALYSKVNDPALTDMAKIKISYNILNSATQFSDFKPCIKRYLYSQFRSKFILVSPNTWDIALFLPTESFQGATNSQVWSDSRKALK